MSQSFWLIVIFVATIACNAESRPQDERGRNYNRSNDPKRYGKHEINLTGEESGTSGDGKYRMKRDTEPVTFVRIDIPRNKTRNSVLRAMAETNPIDNDDEKVEEEVQYVPVALSSKRNSQKKWPSGQTGIETPDDLYLYNTYTSSINDKFKPNNQVVPYISNKKPAIIIIEELTTRRPYYEKPPYPTNSYTYTPIEVITYRPEPTKPSYFGTSYPIYPTTTRPIYPSEFYKPVQQPVPTKKPVCPSVTVTATNTIVNNNKEGCNDIKINIESIIHNTNNLSIAPSSGAGVQNDVSTPITVTPVISVTDRPEDDSNQFFGLGIGDFFNSFTTFSGLTLFNPISLTFLSTIFSPLLVLLAGGVGVAALMLPCAIFSGRNQRRNSNDGTTVTVPATKTVPDIEAIAVVARATSDRPAPVGAEISHDDFGQMVETDIRTPPKLKEIMQGKIWNDGKKQQETAMPMESGMPVDRIEANGRFELPDASERASSLPYVASEGKGNYQKKDEDLGVTGIAVPVLMDDVEIESTTPSKKLQKIPEMKPAKDDKKKTNTKPIQNQTTTPSSGLSTWILLSDNRESTTSSPKKSNKKETAKPEKTVTTTKKPVKAQTTTAKPTKTEPPKTTLVTKKVMVTPKPEIQNENLSALEVMVKNQKKNAQTAKGEEMTTTKLPSQKKQTTVKPTRINDRMDGAESKTELIEARKPSTIPPTLLMATQNPTTVALSDQQGSGQTTTDSPVETTTKKKKTSSKKKKKNKNRRRKPSNGTTTQIEQKTNVIKTPKQPVGAQLYNFLSREIMPTVGLGLVGVLVTAGLAGLLGYNPFVSGNLPVRRTYEIQHGYSPNSYYSYNTDYSDGGQSEEALFREVLSGMPEGSRYGLTNTENSYPEAQIYNSQDQVYDSMKGKPDKKYQNTESTGQYQYPDTKKEDETSSYDAVYSQDYSSTYAAAYDSPEVLKTRDNSDKYPIYDREVSASYVYPEANSPEKSSRLNEEYDSTGQYSDTPTRYGSDKMSSKYSKTKSDTIERQPEALYRVAGDYEHPYRAESAIQGVTSQNSWHRIGSAMDYRKFSHLEPGPRSLNFTKEEILAGDVAKKRTKRDADSVIQRIARKQTTENADKEMDNEIDSDDHLDDSKTRLPETPTTDRTEMFTEDSANPVTEADYDVIETNPITYNFLDVLKRLAQYKLKMGLSFLRSTTDAFSRYLDVIQKRVDESITNTTMVYRIRRNPEIKSRRRRAAETKKRNKKVRMDVLKKSVKKN